MTGSRKAVLLLAAVGVVLAGALAAIRFVQQQRSQSASLLDIAARLARLETKLGTDAGDAAARLARLETKLGADAGDIAERMSRIESALSTNRTLPNDMERLQREGFAEIRSQLDRVDRALHDRLIDMQRASATNSQCQPIAKLPARIERPGVYCLQLLPEYSLLLHEDAITVAADDVTIDLRGGALRGHGTGDTISAGIYSAGYRNLAVSNGTISGFMWGIRYDGPPPERIGGGSVVFRDLIIRDNGFRGIYVDFGRADTTGSVSIADSIIDRVGGTTAIANPFAIGIELKFTKSCRIFGNRIVDVLPVGLGEGVGISFTRGNGGCVAEQNYLLNSKPPEWGRTIGVWPGDKAWDPSFVFRNNVIFNYTYPFMHNSPVSVFTDNLFHSVGCSPRNVSAYFDAYVSLNRWINQAAVCADHPDYFRAAAEAGDAKAQFRMGTTYWESLTVSGSAEQAWYWFGLASRNGLSAATDWINLQRDAHRRQPSHWIPPEYRDQ